MTEIVVVGLGGNLDGPEQRLPATLEKLADTRGCRLLRHSALYRSAPIGPSDQPDFINAVAQLETTLPPLAFLDLLQEQERCAGRIRRRRWGERTLDLDILLWGKQTINRPRLIVPHPEMTRRAFVLRPLLDLLPQACLPDGAPLAGYWTQVADQPLHRLHLLEEDRFAVRTPRSPAHQ